MEELKVIFASNLIELRTRANLTQMELASKINYSDKSVSKWERAEALPDVTVVKNLADTFGVTVDYMLAAHDQWEPDIRKVPVQRQFNEKVVTKVALIGVLTIATLVFVIFWIMGNKYWIILISAIPACLILLLVLNTLWNGRRHNRLIVEGIVFGIFAVVYFIFRAYNPWQLIFVLIPAELAVLLSYRISPPKKANLK